MRDSAAGALIGIVMSPLVLLLVYVTIRGATSEPIDRFGLTGIRTKATQRSDAAWIAGHRAALPVAKRALPVVLGVDAVCVLLLFVGPGWCLPWLGILPAVALLAAMAPIVRSATKAADAAR